MKRIENKQLLSEVKEKPCLCCGRVPSDPHHVTTKGAGGGDTEDNVMELCRNHHQMAHKSGMKHMIENYPKVLWWLVKMQRFDVLEKIERKSS